MAAALAVIGLSGCTVAQRTEVESAGHEFSVDADVDEPVELPEAHTICVNSSIDRLQQLIFTLARGGD